MFVVLFITTAIHVHCRKFIYYRQAKGRNQNLPYPNSEVTTATVSEEFMKRTQQAFFCFVLFFWVFLFFVFVFNIFIGV